MVTVISSSIQKDEARNAFMEASRIGVDAEIHESALFNYGKLSYRSAFYTAAVSALQDYLKKYPKGKEKNRSAGVVGQLFIKYQRLCCCNGGY